MFKILLSVLLLSTIVTYANACPVSISIEHLDLDLPTEQLKRTASFYLSKKNYETVEEDLNTKKVFIKLRATNDYPQYSRKVAIAMLTLKNEHDQVDAYTLGYGNRYATQRRAYHLREFKRAIQRAIGHLANCSPSKG